VEFHLAAPSPALRGHATAYAGFAERTARPVRREELPFGGVAVILALDGTWRIDGMEFASFAGGLIDAPVVSEHAGVAELVQIDLTPPGARALLGVPGRELAGAVVALEDLLGPAAGRLVEQLRATHGWTARFALVDRFLVRRLAAARQASPDVVRAWSRLQESGGTLPVGELARELGCSTRHLARRFGEDVGMTPKAYARLLRFERVVTRMRTGERDLSRLAIGCGYYDQAHFNRDFRSYTGTTPTALIADVEQRMRSLRSDPSKIAADAPHTVLA
jgi:AraC-like DNA-binding protein